MAFRRLCIVLGVILVGGASAHANPVSIEVLRVRQVPGTQHVQLTFGVDTGIGQTDFAAPTSLTRDGGPIGASWQQMTSGYIANTGSGLTTVAATQTCDCDVPVGDREWRVTVADKGWELAGSLTVQADLGDPGAPAMLPDTGPASELQPWDIPEPAELQGLDCQAVCDGPPVEAVADAGGGDPPPSGGGATTTTTTTTDGGSDCRAGTGPAAPGSLALLLLALLWLAGRRRQ